MDVQSIIIEGGAKTLALFIDANLWDEARIIKSAKNLGEGIKAPHLDGILKESIKVSDDELKILLNM
ncbi:hypothetical protein D3C86_2042500 [compost metagenome]